MKILPVLLALGMAGAAGSVAPVPNAGPGAIPSAEPGPVSAPRAAEREFVPDGVEALGEKAKARIEFRLEHTMLELATRLSKDNKDLERVIAGLNGITVRSYGFSDGVAVDPAVMEAISQQYQAEGFMHLVKQHKAEMDATTDVWVLLDATTIREVAVLMVKPRRVDFVSASGSVSPLDLMHLSGHFGIPKMDSGVAVPVPQGKP